MAGVRWLCVVMAIAGTSTSGRRLGRLVVVGVEQLLQRGRVYAPGDAGDFPVKQAFLAWLQADAVADDIASMIAPASVPRPRPFVPTSMWLIEMFDKAAFVQVPLVWTGDPEQPVGVDRTVPRDHRIGVSLLWRVGKKALGWYLPWQGRAGRPFHGGWAWRTMEMVTRATSRTVARG